MEDKKPGPDTVTVRRGKWSTPGNDLEVKPHEVDRLWAEHENFDHTPKARPMNKPGGSEPVQSGEPTPNLDETKEI